MSDFLDVHAMADGQVSPAEAKALQQELEGNSALHAEYEAICQLKQALQDHCKGIHCEETWSSCRERLVAIDKADRVNSFVGKYAWQLCGSFVVLILLAGAWARMGNHSRALDPSQVPTMAGFSAMPSGNADPFGFQRFLRDNDKWRLAGTWVTINGGREVVRYDLLDGLGPFALYVVPGVAQVEGTGHGEVQGHNWYSWSHNGNQFIVISDRDHSELEAIAAKINRQP